RGKSPVSTLLCVADGLSLQCLGIPWAFPGTCETPPRQGGTRPHEIPYVPKSPGGDARRRAPRPASSPRGTVGGPSGPLHPRRNARGLLQRVEILFPVTGLLCQRDLRRVAQYGNAIRHLHGRTVQPALV